MVTRKITLVEKKKKKDGRGITDRDSTGKLAGKNKGRVKGRAGKAGVYKGGSDKKARAYRITTAKKKKDAEKQMAFRKEEVRVRNTPTPSGKSKRAPKFIDKKRPY